jgi:hypothetical protein
MVEIVCCRASQKLRTPIRHAARVGRHSSQDTQSICSLGAKTIFKKALSLVRSILNHELFKVSKVTVQAYQTLGPEVYHLHSDHILELHTL